ncbi:hypothetical protein [Corynebacterium pacaense]|uniref:hypothetical protein n=1 Tax=Corynebacterium pacaense TaxID=1816684 RepID=UPI0009BA091D|nr:hypothetical protein [Corynebacterium pacaense]
MRKAQSLIPFSVAAVLCVVALIVRFAGAPMIVPVLCLIIAAIALFIGLRNRAGTVDQPVVFTAEQVQKLRELKERGQESAAIRQAQLWSRGSSAEAVAEAVRKL